MLGVDYEKAPQLVKYARPAAQTVAQATPDDLFLLFALNPTNISNLLFI